MGNVLGRLGLGGLDGRAQEALPQDSYPKPSSRVAYFGAETAPIKSKAPLRSSRIAHTNGRSMSNSKG